MQKNWHAIYQIKQPLLRLAIATLKLDNEEGRLIAERLPEFFSSKETLGPIPLSVLKQLAMQVYESNKEYWEGYSICEEFPPEEQLVTLGVLDEMRIPYQEVRWPESQEAYEQVPHDGIYATWSFGHVFSWHDEEFVVVQTSSYCSLFFAPTSAIAAEL